MILNPELPSRAKAKIALTLGEADKMLGDGADEELQLLNVALQVVSVACLFSSRIVLMLFAMDRELLFSKADPCEIDL